MAEQGTPAGGQAAAPSALRRYVPLVLLCAAIAAAAALRLDRYLSFQTLADNRTALLAEVDRLGLWAPIAFVGLYAAATAISLPGGVYLSIAGGFLFGTILGSFCVLIGAVAGATAIFVIAKTSLGDALLVRARPYIGRFEAGFRANALSYLLALRLIPIFPFWLVNLVPAFLGVRLGTFVLGTAIGIVPATVVFTSLGNGLGAIVERGERIDPAMVIGDPKVWAPLLGLAGMALVPVIYRWVTDRRDTRRQGRR